MVKTENKYLQLFRSYQRMLLNILLVTLALIFVVRPFMRKFSQVAEEIRKLPAPAAGPSVEEQISALLLDKPMDRILGPKEIDCPGEARS